VEKRMIVSFADRATEDLYHGRATSRVRRFPNDIIAGALVKLDMLDAAHRLVDLVSPPGNRLEALKGELKGLHSVRVNEQWRVVFRWEDERAHGVRLLDYHS
jgi:proteic killer suppression protein